MSGRHFVTASETREKSRLNEQRLKVLSHGDWTSARMLYQRRFQFQSVSKIWLAMNHKPIVADSSFGFWRSVRLIPFERQFLGTHADKNLTRKLKAEASGILAWAVKACLEWQCERELGLPDAVVDATEEYETESDPLQEFLSARCVQAPEYKVGAGTLYREYSDWAEVEGLKDRETMSRTAFGRRIAGRFKKNREGSQRRLHYYGIGLLRGKKDTV